MQDSFVMALMGLLCALVALAITMNNDTRLRDHDKRVRDLEEKTDDSAGC